MMKTKNMFLAAMILLFTLLCAGCTKNPEEADPVNIAFILGVLDDETVVNTGIDELTALPARPGTEYSLISAEGTPTLIGAGSIADLSSRRYTEVMMDRIYEGIRADLTEQLATYTPTVGEIDMANAISLGIRALNAHRVDGRQNILVLYCGGKSTSGLINMLQTPVYQMDIDASAQTIAKKMNVSMEGIDEVIWYCCGEYGSNQPKLNSEEKAKLKAFYTQLFMALGMNDASVTFREDLPSSEYYSFPDTPVSAMAVEGTFSGLQKLTSLNEINFKERSETIFESPIVITEGQIGYKPDSSDFLDPVAASEVLEPIAEYLITHKDQKILLYSTCAGDTDSDYSMKLAAQRSERISEILQMSGIEQERITVVAVKKSEDPYFEFARGTGSAGSINRKTVIMDINSDLSQHFLNRSF